MMKKERKGDNLAMQIEASQEEHNVVEEELFADMFQIKNG